MKICEYGCGQKAKYQFKNSKWCCEKSKNQCPEQRKIISIANKGKIRTEETILKLKEAKKNITNDTRKKMSESHKGKKQPLSVKKKIRKTLKKYYTVEKKKYLREIHQRRKHTIKTKRKMKERCKNEKVRRQLRLANKLTISKIKEKYPLYSKIEEMRYNPDKPGEKEIQVHCKNHNCKNSKEKGGWFTPTPEQVKLRRSWIEREGRDLCYFYCSQHCKDTCILFGLSTDPYRDINKPYTNTEYQTYKAVVFERENNLCEYCGEPATDIHHIFPVKLEPFFALDPDFCVACCEKCHYKFGHKNKCSTGNLAKIVCSTNSQKFLNQSLENI